jgi:hypothetical protein
VSTYEIGGHHPHAPIPGKQGGTPGRSPRIGQEINPYVQPYIAAGLDALLLPDINDPSIILAQNNKQTRKRIDGLQKQIDLHNKKLDKDPKCDAANHWRNEISAWQSEIDRLRVRLPNGR